MHACMYACMYICMVVCVLCVFVCMCVCVCVYVLPVDTGRLPCLCSPGPLAAASESWAQPTGHSKLLATQPLAIPLLHLSSAVALGVHLSVHCVSSG